MKSQPRHTRSLWQRGLLLATVLATFGLIGVMTGTWPGTADAQPERYVDPVNGDDTANDCSDEANPCQTIAHAITQASDPDTIILAAGTYNEADLLIDGIDLTIQGESEETTFIDAGGSGRVFMVTDDASLTLADLTITGGKATDGGGIYNDGELELNNVLVVGNGASGDGGGIFNSATGTARLNDSQVGGTVEDDANTADSDGGGIFTVGGAVDTLYLTNTTIVGNSALENGGGIASINDTVIITDSFILNNTAGLDGGGIYALGAPTDATVEIDGSTISGNEAERGGGIFNDGDTFVITNSTIGGETSDEGNHATDDGGGIENDGDGVMTITETTISFNVADDDGGGLDNDSGEVTLTDSTVSNDSAGDEGGGLESEGTLNLFDTDVVDNTADNDGGGISVEQDGQVTINGGRISGNEAISGDGGGIFNEEGHVELTDVTVGGDTEDEGNTAASRGGGIYTEQPEEGNDTVILTRTIVRSNEAVAGGGIYNNGDHVELWYSTVADNEALDGNGGGIYTAGGPSIFSLEIDRSTINDNEAAGAGGGIYNDGDTVTMINSTVSGNEAGAGGGGGIYNSENPDGTISLTNVTIAFNESAELSPNSGIHNDGDVDNVTLLNTIVAENDPVDCTGEVTSLGNNLDSDGSCSLDEPTDIVNGNADLQALAFNGGPTQTHALGDESEAIDEGDETTCETVSDPWDQRGSPFDRIFGSSCDIGAYEAQPEPDDGGDDEDEATPTATATATPEPKAQLTIAKEVVGNQRGDFFFASDFLGPFTLSHGESETAEVDPGTYAVWETGLYSQDLYDVVCDGGSPQPIVNGVSVTLEDGDDVTCTFINVDQNVGGVFGPLPQRTPTPVPPAAVNDQASITPPSTGDAGLR